VEELLYALKLIQALLTAGLGFVAGTPVNESVPIGTKIWTISAVEIPGPTAQYPALTGNFFSELGAAFGDVTEVELGQPVSIAVKVKATWVGLTATPAAG
jgi:hypothetical protein